MSDLIERGTGIRIGVAYPQNELGGDPAALRRFGVAVEHLGYDHLLMYDHVVGAVHTADRRIPLPERAYHEKDPFHDPFVAFSHLAALTERIEFITGVLVLPQRQTALVARQAADVALLSSGRLRLGVGVGYNAVEYDALGMAFDTRGARMAEQITYLRRLWTGEPLTWEGRFDRIDQAASYPPPSTPIPILYGGSSEAAYRRAARLADGFIFGYALRPEAVDAWQRVAGLVVAEGRDLDSFRAVFNLLPDRPGGSSIAEVVAALPRLRDAGASDVTVSTARHGLRGVEEHLAFLEDLRERATEVLR